MLAHLERVGRLDRLGLAAQRHDYVLIVAASRLFGDRMSTITGRAQEAKVPFATYDKRRQETVS